jgi:RHS repeat-associated protein
VKRQRVECAYDAQGRRIYKRVLTAEGMSTTFILKQSVVFLYDGWNMIAEIDTTTSARLIRSYEWGTDLSGTMDGAGGVGGLLVLRTHPSTINTQPSPGAYAPTYDGNGNVMELVNLANGSVSARYEYGAFGETISVDGEAVADANPIRFSTKYLDGETGLLYYTHRYYDAANGRWLSRDPIGEEGGVNLYGMVQNDPVNRVDYLGLFSTYWSAIDLTEANNHYRTGGGFPVRISFDLVDTKDVKIADDFNDVEEWLEDQTNWTGGCTAGKKNFPDARYGFTTTGTGDANLVLGDITLKFTGDVEIDCKCKYKIM